MASSDSIAAIATAPGRGGIGVVRVSGAAVGNVIDGVVGKPLAPRMANHVKFRDGAGAAIDEGIALYFPAPHSYTGEDVLELQGHGGPVVMQLLLHRCLDLGVRLAEPGEFTRRAFLNDKLDLVQAESVIDLIEAATAQAARGAMRSLEGCFSEEIHVLKEKLVGLRMLVEATLDFPEEEIDFLRQHDAEGKLGELVGDVERVTRVSEQGRLLREGITVVLAGRPNVGKSSLLNRLAGHEAAIVTDIPGTTRDAVREVIDLDGVPVHIIDTAGLREAQDAVEKIGVVRAKAAIARADLVLWVSDASVGETQEDRAAFAHLPPGMSFVHVANKIDLIAVPAGMEMVEGKTIIRLSAQTGEGVPVLRQAILEAAGWQQQGEGTYLARERHLSALTTVARHLALARGKASALELFAEELRLAHEALNSITGEFTADDLLGEIFSRFCIGK